MENLSTEKIVYHLRNICSSKKESLRITNLLQQVENYGLEKQAQHRILKEILPLFYVSTSSSAEKDNGFALGCVIWMTHLQERQKLPLLDEYQFYALYEWLLQQIQFCGHDCEIICKMLIALECLFALHPANGTKYFVTTTQNILKYISNENAVELLVTSIQCLDKILCTLKDVKLSDEQIEVCTEIGCAMLQICYKWKIDVVENVNVLLLILGCIQILNKVITMSLNFAKMNVGELLGLAKACFNFGVDATNCLPLNPLKVCMSQQALYDSAEEIEIVINSENARNSGGKTPKTRKPRGVVKNVKANDKSNSLRSLENKETCLIFDILVSESEVSDPESSTNCILLERNRKGKIRLTAINLVGTLSRLLERKTLFGYWHALFPNGTAELNDNLLYIGQHDPNIRCRSTALQVCAQLLYGSKGFLHQAEMNAKRCPTAFIPFSVSLGNMIRAIYKSLSMILSSESALPVLTQALKCLAVLVQASPVQQFEKGFVQSFVKDVKPLIYHRDPAIQVSALMVMEFLLVLPELTSDIAEVVGLSPELVKKKFKKLPNLNDKENDIIEIEEFIESDDENCTVNMFGMTRNDVCTTENSSWLLLRVLRNLTEQNNKVISTSVRIECLQVLIVMSSHFAMVKSNLPKVAEVLIYSLSDCLPDIRLYAARCVDAYAYQINRYLLENVQSYSELEMQECVKFWINMMPIVVGHIRRDSEEMLTVRIALCDALSNIGALMFENTSHSSQISLLSFLSGVSSDNTEETIVRAASARALAVFALYPSLREDLVFIENTAELTLRLVKDPNLLVRVKSFWSLGNISDAIIGKVTETLQYRSEKISDDLLFRLINASITACSDNDKVRCNAVRTLGNLLRLLTDDHFLKTNKTLNWRQTFEMAIGKLTDCIRSSGNAKVKWNTCYAISNLMRNQSIFQISNLNWQETLFSSLCHIIVHHSNFKVRINASIAITNIRDRSHFDVYYERFWISVIKAIEQSYNLDNFHEYNHRDNLQDQLCLALAHIVTIAADDDLLMLKKSLLPYIEVIHNTWKRVINRMVPENAAPLISCPVILLERKKLNETLPFEYKSALELLIETLTVE